MHQVTRRLTAAVLMFAVLSGGARPAVLLGSEPAAGPDQPAFVNSFMQAGMLEIEASKMAVNASTNATVKAFAEQMIMDHQKAGAELAAIAARKGIVLPEKLDQEHAQVMQSLRDKLLKEFDAAYVAQMIRDHAEMVKLFELNMDIADSDLAAFIAKTLPVLREHEQLTGDLEQSL